MAKRTFPVVLGRVALILFGLLLLGAAWLWAQLPASGPDRIEAGERVVGIKTDGGSYAWIVRTAGGAVLVDAGLDPDAGAILGELQRQGLRPEQVLAVLLTHAHGDHWAGTRVFPQAKVYVGEADLPILRGEQQVTAPMARLFAKLAAPKTPPANVEPLNDGQKLNLDGATFEAIHIPGHTPGSTMFLYEELLFTGDSLLADDGELTVMGGIVSEDVEQNRQSLRKLQEQQFTRIADGHTGLHDASPAALGPVIEGK